MCRNIHKNQSICKGTIGPKVIISTISTLLLGFKACGENFWHLSSRYTKIQPSSLKSQAVSQDSGSFSKKDDDNCFLGGVSYLKMDHHLGFIRIDPANQFRVIGSKNMGLLFYAPRDLMNCATIHLSDQGVALSYLDGSSEVLPIIEVDGAFLDRLSKEADPLLHKDGHSRLEATCITGFTILNVSDYGIESLNDTENMLSEGGIVLLQGNEDKERLEHIDHAGFMLTKCACMSELVELVRHLSTNTVHATNSISSASVCGNRLKADTTSTGDVAYGYIRNGNRYRLIPLSNNGSSIKGYQYNGAMDSLVVSQIVASNANKTTQEVATVTDGLKKPKQISDRAVQAESSLLEKDCHDDRNGPFISDSFEDSWDSHWDFPQYENNDDNTLWNTSSIRRSIFNQNLDESDHAQQECTGDQKAYNDRDDQIKGNSLENSGIYSDGLEEDDNESDD